MAQIRARWHNFHMEQMFGSLPLAVEMGTIGWLASGSLLFGIIGFFVAGTKGNSCWGCILGLILGPIGLLIAMLIPRDRG